MRSLFSSDRGECFPMSQYISRVLRWYDSCGFHFLRAFLTHSGTVILSDKPLSYFCVQFKLNLMNSSDLLNVYNKGYTKKYSTTIFVLNIFCHAHLTTSRTYRTYPTYLTLLAVKTWDVTNHLARPRVVRACECSNGISGSKNANNCLISRGSASFSGRALKL
jgi:hypothetical protein